MKGARIVQISELSEKEKLQLTRVLLGFLMNIGARSVTIDGHTLDLKA